ncbi:MAG: RloB family protein [Rikenellaceae bacterium]
MMMRKRRQLHRSIGIVCEGTKTENVYIFKVFEGNPALNKVRRHIIPKETREPRVTRANNKRPQRNLKGSELMMYHELCESNRVDYNKYKSQPLRYVREAYLLKEEENCNEVWAIFDKDFHPSHRRAFDFAQRWDVNIAFSSLSFEQWVLLHFEKSMRKFNLVQCKDRGGVRACSVHTPCREQDNECLCGYLRRSHISNYAKSDSGLYKNLSSKIGQAVENAAWLRFQYRDSKSRIYWRNPYCDMDRLVLHLINLDAPHVLPVEWFELGYRVSINQWLHFIVSVRENVISIRLFNSGSMPSIVHQNTIYTSKEYGKNRSKYSDVVRIEANDNITVFIENIELHPYFNLEYNNIRYICELKG